MLQQFIENVKNKDGKDLAEKTKNAYHLTLKKIETYFKKDLHTLLLDKLNQEEVYNYIQELKVGDKRKYDICCIIYKYICHFKEELHQDYFQTKCVSVVVITEEKKDAKKLLPNKEKLIEILENAEITNLENKLILNLLLKYDSVQRCDIATVKLKNFDIKNDNYISEGKLILNSLNKVKNKKPILIELLDEDQELVLKLDHQEYLFSTNAIDKCNAYSKMVSKITLNYLGVRLSQTNFRVIHSMHNYNKIQNDESLNFKEKYIKFNELCIKMGHSSDISMNTYVNI